jgi:3-hydroxyisobutyrate dehydrogenase-like beta-hydroxyacid dehydrogenase
MARKYYIPITRSGSSILASVGTQMIRRGPNGCGCLVLLVFGMVVLIVVMAVVGALLGKLLE